MKITYYIFGEEAINIYNDEGIDALVLAQKEDEMFSFGMFAFIEGKSKSIDLIEAFDGWADYTTIYSHEYEKVLFSREF